MSDPTVPDKPIVVEHLRDIITWQSVRVVALGACAIAADRFMTSETAINAVMAGAGFLLTYGYGVFKAIRGHWKQITMARLLPDDVAQIKGEGSVKP